MLLRSTLIYAPAILLTRISALLLLVIATRLIDQTEYGLLTLVVTVGEMTDVAVTNWLRIALLRCTIIISAIAIKRCCPP